LKEAMPFAVSGSTTFIEANGRKVRGRVYPWGIVEIENPEHCDFIKLRTMLIAHMQDLQEVTQEVHYENYRLQKLAAEARAGVKAELMLEDSLSISSSVDGDEMKKILQEKEAELRKMQALMAKMQADMNQKS
jgi:septin family protein